MEQIDYNEWYSLEDLIKDRGLISAHKIIKKIGFYKLTEDSDGVYIERCTDFFAKMYVYEPLGVRVMWHMQQMAINPNDRDDPFKYDDMFHAIGWIKDEVLYED